MTENQSKESTATTSLWNVCAALDDNHAQLIRIANMLQVFDESLEGEVRFLQEHKVPSHFASRYDILSSLLDTAQLGLIDMIGEMRAYIDQIYKHCKITGTAELAEN